MMLSMLPASFADYFFTEELPYEQLTEEERLEKEKAEKKRLAELAAQQAAAAEFAAQQAAAAEFAAQQAAAAEEALYFPEAFSEGNNSKESVYEEPVNTSFEGFSDIIFYEEDADAEPVEEEISIVPVEEEIFAAPVEEEVSEDEFTEEPVEEEPTEEPVEEAAEIPTEEESAEAPAEEEPAEAPTEEESAETPTEEEPTEAPAEEEPTEKTGVIVGTDLRPAAEEVLPEDNAPAEDVSDKVIRYEDEKSAAPLTNLADAAEAIWKTAYGVFKTLQQAIEDFFGKGDTTGELKVELTKNAVVTDGIDISVAEGQNVVIDLCKKTLNVISGIAAKISGKGSVKLENGTITSQSETAPVVQTSVDNLTVKNMTLKGAKNSVAPVLNINGGNVHIVGQTNILAGNAKKAAIKVDDSKKSSNVTVSTNGVVRGSVSAYDTLYNGKTTRVKLHNGFYNGKVSTDDRAVLTADGGDYTQDIAKYLDPNVNYASISSPFSRVYSVGKNIGWSALRSAMCAPTAVNVLRAPFRSISLPGGILAKNSTGRAILVNGRPLFKGGIAALPGCRHICCNPCKSSACVVDGANSIWYKGCKDGLTYELSGDVSYVTIDGTKVDAEIDGVYAELNAETFELLKAGMHTVRFVLTNGCVAVTNIKIVPDKEVVWVKGSKNGLNYEMTGKIAKVLIDHVKIAAEINGKNSSVSASILQDLKTGNHTVEFVLENTGHVVTSITVE